ncbi:MAG: DUF4830 domain-containing protein [Ruminococcaceae bacterium]|nr:DUF4830 domain-containing protein [Oscillospiraceae bacterium]
MFVYSVNKRQIKLALIVFCLLTMCLILAALTKQSIETIKINEYNLSAKTADERIAYLSQFGWSVNPEPVEVKEIIIPAEFDEVYSNYNNIQKEQGFDLEQYKAQRAKKWTYTVINYPGYEGKDCIRATLLIINGKVIGGDVCSVELNGFMHGFLNPASETAQDVNNETISQGS